MIRFGKEMCKEHRLDDYKTCSEVRSIPEKCVWGLRADNAIDYIWNVLLRVSCEN